MKVSEIYPDYARLKKSVMTPRSYKSLVCVYDRHIASVFGNKDFFQLNYLFYQNFANNLLDSGLAPKTVKNILTILSGIINFSIKNIIRGKSIVLPEMTISQG